MDLDFLEAIHTLLKNNMTGEGFSLWDNIKNKTPMIMHRPSSSSGKYHKNSDGSVRTVGEHTYQILYVALKIMKILNVTVPSESADVLLLAAALHDIFKYGCDDPLFRKTTEPRHDKMIADTLLFNKARCIEVLRESNFNKLEHICRFHSGKWSTDATPNFDLNMMPVETMFIHMLDVLSAENLLKIPDA